MKLRTRNLKPTAQKRGRREEEEEEKVYNPFLFDVLGNRNLVSLIYHRCYNVQSMVALSLCNQSLYMESQKILPLLVLRWHRTNFPGQSWSSAMDAMLHRTRAHPKDLWPQFMEFFIYKRGSWNFEFCEPLVIRGDVALLEVVASYLFNYLSTSLNVFYIFLKKVVHVACDVGAWEIIKWAVHISTLRGAYPFADHHQFLLRATEIFFARSDFTQWTWPIPDVLENQAKGLGLYPVKDLFSDQHGFLDRVIKKKLIYIFNCVDSEEAIFHIDRLCAFAWEHGMGAVLPLVVSRAIDRSNRFGYYNEATICHVARLGFITEPDPERPWAMVHPSEDRVAYREMIIGDLVQTIVYEQRMTKRHPFVHRRFRCAQLANALIKAVPFLEDPWAMMAGKRLVEDYDVANIYQKRAHAILKPTTFRPDWGIMFTHDAHKVKKFKSENGVLEVILGYAVHFAEAFLGD